jgi:hypothetical protein
MIRAEQSNKKKKKFKIIDLKFLLIILAGKPLKDEDSLAPLVDKLNAGDKLKLYFKDLGPQVGWTTVSFVQKYDFSL